MPGEVAQVRQDSTAALARALAHPRFEVVPLPGVEEQARYLPRGAKVPRTLEHASTRLRVRPRNGDDSEDREESTRRDDSKNAPSVAPIFERAYA